MALQDRAEQAAQARRQAAGDQPDPGAAVATRKKKPDEVRVLLDQFKSEIKNQLPGHIRLEAFMRMALTGIKNSKQYRQLLACNRPSLYAALLESARYGLMPFTNEAAIVPFGKTATFIPMYQGLVQLFLRTGRVKAVTARLIYRNDEWDLAYGDGGGFIHRPRYFNERMEPVDRGEPILAYCYVKMDDGTHSEPTIVTRWEAEQVMREHSRAWEYAEFKKPNLPGSGKKDSPWHTNFWDMALKTAVRRHARWVPQSSELVELLLAEATRDEPGTALAVAPPPAGLSDVDWSVNVEGTAKAEILESTYDEEGFPEGSVPADQYRGNGDSPPPGPAGADADAGDAGDAAATVPQGGAQDDAPPPPPAPGPTAPAPASGAQEPAQPQAQPKPTPRTAGQLNMRFGRIGWQGDAKKPDRLLVMAILARPQSWAAWPPLTSTNGLTETEAQRAIANFDAQLTEHGDGLAAAFERLAVAARAEQAGAGPEGGDQE